MKRLKSGLGLPQLLPNPGQVKPWTGHLGLQPYRLVKLKRGFAKKGFRLIFHRSPRSNGLVGQVEKPNTPMKMFFIGIIRCLRNFKQPPVRMKENAFMLGLFLGLGDKPVELHTGFGKTAQFDQ